jgi:hypothetical protein
LIRIKFSSYINSDQTNSQNPLQLYHACDQDVFSFCLMKYTVLQFCDFYTATMTYWVTILAMGGLPDQAK